MYSKILVVAVGIWTLGFVGRAQAAVIFSDLSSFNSAVSGSTLIDDYNDPLPFFPTFPLDRGEYTIHEVEAVLAASGGEFILGFGEPSARFDFDSPIQAIGLDYRRIGNNNNTKFTIAAGGFSTDVTTSFSRQFVGVIFDAPVSSVFIGDNLEGNINIDNLRTAEAQAVAAVPEPASLTIWGVAALGVGLIAGRRRKKAMS